MKTPLNIRTWLSISIFALTAAISSQAQPLYTPPSSGLVSWWRAESNGLDSAGNNTAFAALDSSGVSFAPGKVGQGFNLPDTNAYLIVPASPSLDVGAGNGLTIEGWIKVSSVSGFHPIVEWHGNSREQAGVQLWLSSNPSQSGVLFGAVADVNSNQHPLISPSGVVQPNVFQHVAMTYDKVSGVGTLYLNGTVVAQSNLGTFVPATAYNLWFGHRPFDVPGDWTYGAALGGILDELGIYNRALGSNEIAAIYSGGSPAVNGLVVPNYAATNQVHISDGTLNGPSRLQTVYGASEFPPYPIQITEIRWRPDVDAGSSFSTTISNLQIKLSTTAATPDNLNTTFAQNTGADAALVFNGAANFSSAFTTLSDGTKAFDISIPLQTPFTFDSTKGNLLVDVQNLFGCTPARGNTVNGTSSGTDATSRVFAFNPNATTADVADTGGDVLEIIYTAVTAAPVITHQPMNQTVAVAGTATFSVVATGSPTPAYQWFLNNTNHPISGATNSSFTLVNVQTNQAGNYLVQARNSAGYATSSNAVLTVTASGPAVLGLVVPNYAVTNQVHISDGTLNELSRLQTIYGASEFPAYPIQITEIRWRPDVDAGAAFSTIISNLQIKLSTTVATPDHLSTTFAQNTGTNETLVFSGAANFSSAFTTLNNGTKAFDISIPLQTPFTFDSTKGNLLVDLRNLFGCTPARGNSVNGTSGTADAVSRVYNSNPNATTATGADTGGDVLEIIYTAVTAAPVITNQPMNQTVAVGGTAMFSVAATGTAPLFYRWYDPSETLIPGATTSTLTLSNVQLGASGTYFVLITNLYGSAQSSNAVLTVTGGSNTNSCTPPPSGLVGWWKGESNTLDSAGSNNGLVANGIISYAPGKVGNAFHYTDDPGYVTIPAAAALDVGQGSGFTLEAWIQPGDTVDELPIFEWQYNTNNDYTGTHFWISAIGGAGCLFANIIDSSNNSHWIYSAPGIVTADYQHVALTYDKASGMASIYRNGILVTHSNLGSFTPNTTGNLLLGERTYLGGEPQFHYVGNLDEMSLYSRALGSNEIATIYQAGSNGKCPVVSGTAPVITQQPTNQTVLPGANVSFSVTATGTMPLYYQWYDPSETRIPGAVTSTLTLSNVQPSANGAYSVLVTNQFGFTISSNAVLTVTNPPVLCVSAPTNIAAWWPAEGNGFDIIGGATATLQGGATFAPGEVGQAFLLNATNDYLTAMSSNLNIAAVNGSFSAEAWIKVSDVAGYHPIVEWNDTLGHGGVHMWILPYTGESAGVLFANLVDTSGISHSFHSPGGTMSTNVFQHVALTYDHGSGVATLYRNGAVVAQLTAGVFNPQTSYPFFMGHRPGDPSYLGGLLDEVSLYRRALSTSEIAAIYNAGTYGKCTPGVAPVITNQPISQTVLAGANVTFSVIATGTDPLHYQWYNPSQTLIPGATTATLTLSNVQPSANGTYSVLVTNQFGFAISSNAVLTVTNPPTSSCVSAPTNIAAWWPAEGNGSDIIGGATATLQGGATFAPGEVGQAFLLNATNDYLTAMSSNLNIAAVNGSFSAEAWIKVSDVAGYHPIVEWNDTLGHGGVHMWILPYTGESAGVLFANLVDTSGISHSFHSPGGTMSTNVFQHVALTYDHGSGVATLYRNGAVVAQLTAGVFNPQTSYPFFMGHRPGDPSYLGGLLDEVSLYRRALGTNEIAAIYNAEANGKCPVTPVPHAVSDTQPIMKLSLKGNSPALSWPVWAGDAVLQAADSLTEPVKWTNVPLVLPLALTTNSDIEITLPTQGKQGFFRLVHP